MASLTCVKVSKWATLFLSEMPLGCLCVGLWLTVGSGLHQCFFFSELRMEFRTPSEIRGFPIQCFVFALKIMCPVM